MLQSMEAEQPSAIKCQRSGLKMAKNVFDKSDLTTFPLRIQKSKKRVSFPYNQRDYSYVASCLGVREGSYQGKLFAHLGRYYTKH